jgi:hypothetical protein
MGQRACVRLVSCRQAGSSMLGSKQVHKQGRQHQAQAIRQSRPPCSCQRSNHHMHPSSHVGQPRLMKPPLPASAQAPVPRPHPPTHLLPPPPPQTLLLGHALHPRRLLWPPVPNGG